MILCNYQFINKMTVLVFYDTTNSLVKLYAHAFVFKLNQYQICV